MYYVIKKQDGIPLKYFIGFVVDKYIASKNNDTVIFEFSKNGKIERKWVKKDEIILLTEDKNHFLDIFNQLKTVEALQQELVNHAKEQLEDSMEEFENVMNKEIEKLKETKKSGDMDCILKDF